MSTLSRPYYLIFAVLLQILHFFTNANAQDIDVAIELDPTRPAIANISGRFADVKVHRNLSFVRTFAGIQGLGERVSNVKLFDADDQTVNFQTAPPGEFVSEAPFERWSYAIDLSPRKEQTAAAHVSWIKSSRGILMLGDLLPIVDKIDGKVAAKVTLNWEAVNASTVTLEFQDSANASILVDPSARIRRIRTGSASIVISISGDWLFTDDEFETFTRKIFEDYSKLFGSYPAAEINVRLIKFPSETQYGAWQADTRGGTLTIVSSDMPFKTQSVQRLHEQLRHEIFHLWIPNDLNLSGDYAWFYEGFALYSSLKLAVSENQIRFEDLLDTLSRAQAIDTRHSRRLSLLDASSERWNGMETYLYARGMVTAFLCDIKLLNESKGRRSIDDELRRLYAKHRLPAARAPANESIISVLRSNNDLESVVNKYVLGSDKFDWDATLALAGLENKNGLRVLPKLTGRQKDLLDALGYNNWRRLSRNK
jgi:hypothetical protein